MLDTIDSYEDWNDFFAKTLTGGDQFCLTSSVSKKGLDIEIYSALHGDKDTTIQIEYLSSMTLRFLKILNPKTPGKNKQQENDYFYKYSFDKEKQYGGVGLDFDKVNIDGIKNFLTEGFHGTETIYYFKDSPIKSVLSTNYYRDSPNYAITYYFDTSSTFGRLIKKLFAIGPKVDRVESVDLNEIFPGIHGS